jgi:hypothetical protein
MYTEVNADPKATVHSVEWRKIMNGRAILSYRAKAREEDAASVYGYTRTLRANSQGTSGQAREEGAASVDGYTGVL